MNPSEKDSKYFFVLLAVVTNCTFEYNPLLYISSNLSLDHDLIDDELRKLKKTAKQDLDKQMESLANLVQLKSLEPVLRKDVCSQLQVE